MNKLINESGRTCNKCSTFKAWEMFGLQRTHSSGHKATCKVCYNLAQNNSKEVLTEEFKSHPIIRTFLIDRLHLRHNQAV